MTRGFTIHGARGSQPVWGRAFRRYNGNTTCFSLETAEGIVVIDAGTGIASLSGALARRPRVPPITLLFTHFHLDHVMGLSAFAPLSRRDARVTLMGCGAHAGWRQMLQGVAGRPLWPVELLERGAAVRFATLSQNGWAGPPHRPSAFPSLTLAGVRVSWCPVRHPQECLSYRLERPGFSVVIATDREHGDRRMDRRFLEFCRNADVLVHDAQYTPEEAPRRRGWGHSTWAQAARVAGEAGVRELILTSYDPGRTDTALDAMVAKARREFRATRGVGETLTLR
jgi:ribonuclease BN (tRNA processing enzyme)